MDSLSKEEVHEEATPMQLANVPIKQENGVPSPTQEESKPKPKGKFEAPKGTQTPLVTFPDSDSLEKISKVLRTEFDLEIASRRKELEQINTTLAEAEKLLERLNRCTGYNTNHRTQSSNRTTRVEYFSPFGENGPRRRTKIRAGAGDVFARASDGSFVK